MNNFVFIIQWPIIFVALITDCVRYKDRRNYSRSPSVARARNSSTVRAYINGLVPATKPHAPCAALSFTMDLAFVSVFRTRSSDHMLVGSSILTRDTWNLTSWYLEGYYLLLCERKTRV